MTNEATPQGAPQGAEPKTEKPFPDPPLGEGVDSGQKNSDDTPKMVSPRDAVLMDMDSRIDEERQREITAFQTDLAEATGMEPPAEPGVASVDKMHPEDDDKNSQLPDGLKNDPLADYIVMDGDKAMFRTKVYGEERLIPLDTARTQLQKHVAAEIGLQQVARERKELEEREEQIRKNEAALAQRVSQAPASPPSESQTPDVSDQDLENEAREVISSMFTGTEDEAVKHLTNLLRTTRQPTGPQVDPEEIANQAVAAAKQTLADKQAEEDAARKLADINAGFEQFGKDYPDILGDENLFRYADSLTDSIETEHPDWNPSQVMAEAGKKTREWVESLKGDTASELDPQPDNGRQVRKKNLRPMPQARSAAHEVGEPEETPDTPQSVMDEVRRSRGQA